MKNNRKFLFLTFIFLLVFSLFGCSSNTVKPSSSEIVKFNGKTVVSVSVSKVGKNMLDIKMPHVSYTNKDQDALETFTSAIKSAKKINGIADVTVPDYVFTLKFDDKTVLKYSLWIGDDDGAIMNEDDSNTMYTLSKDVISDLNKYVK
jgi:hypothetical protein